MTVCILQMEGVFLETLLHLTTGVAAEKLIC